MKRYLAPNARIIPAISEYRLSDERNGVYEMTEANQPLLDEREFQLHQEIQPAQAPVLGDGPALLKLSHSINQLKRREIYDC
jgi:hypothetical protein